MNDKSESKKRILETSLELKKALSAWDELSKQEKTLSADEQMLLDLKGLLKDLKYQIEDLDRSTTPQSPSQKEGV